MELPKERQEIYGRIGNRENALQFPCELKLYTQLGIVRLAK